MSLRLAAGWARSRAQSVSVVPMIQCVSHGMMNSTLFSVRLMMPVVAWIRSRGTRMCTPLDARTLNCPRPPTISWISSVHTPAALIVCLALTSWVCPDSRSRTSAPTTRSPSRRKPVTLALVAHRAPYSAAVLAIIIVCRASSTWPS